ncbi:ABC transporter permease [Streptomyces sp. NPDC096339]|uniref:ABC transporter permease n=1 Tax=Streptomyces sp. NPDC096339 TaxID=3366086 RepID=UPI0037F6BC9F
MRTVTATFARQWTTTRRAYPWTYFTATVMQGAIVIAVAYLMFHEVAGGRVDPLFGSRTGTGDYLGYVAIGAIASAFTLRMLLWTAKAMITEEREGTIISLLVAPAGRVPYLTGFVLFAFTSTLLEVASLTLIAALLGVGFPAVDPLGLLLATVLFTAAAFGLSLALNVVMLRAGEAHVSQNTLFLVLFLVCGFTFPTQYLPTAVQWFAEAFPVTSAMDVLRAALGEGFSLADVAGRSAVCLAVSALYIVAGFLLLPRAERSVMERTF